MKRLSSVDELPRGIAFVTTVGVFDGVHRGHQRVLRQTIGAARAHAAEAVAITFDPHPEAVLRGTAPQLLSDPEERLALIEAAGIDVAVVQEFSRQFAAQTAEEFLQRLAGGRDLRGIIMTSETAFGRDRGGSRAAVAELSSRMGFDVVDCPDVMLGGQRISSSRLRQLLRDGQLSEVRRLLGRRYAVIGTVVTGDRRGRQLGYPTANLAFTQPVALPPDGIYAVRATWGGRHPLAPARAVDGVAALGVRPMFGGGARTLEVHLFDFDEDIYGVRLRVEFIRRQRGERKFRSVSALVAQMDRDSERARAILRTAA